MLRHKIRQITTKTYKKGLKKNTLDYITSN